MIKKYFSSLTGYFTLSALLMHLSMMPLLFGGVFYLVESNYQNNFIDQVRNNALILASLSESKNEHALKFQQTILESSVTSGYLYAAQILNTDGDILNGWGNYLPPESRKEDFFFAEHNDSVFNIIVPRYDSNENLRGELFLSYDEQATNEQINLAYRYGFYLSIIYIVITFFLTIILGRQITRPIHQLREASYEISEGHYDKELRIKSGISDIQQLATTLDHMRHELVEKNNEMKHQAMHDSLTGLPNRLFLREKINQFFSISDNKTSTALLMIDLDEFKEINDTLGHLTGDEVLKIAADRLQSCIRQSDTAARLGGDEFAVILTDIDSYSAVTIAQKVSARLQENFTINGNILQVGASIGIALYPEHGNNYKDVCHCADLAMYESKRTRRGDAILYKQQLENR